MTSSSSLDKYSRPAIRFVRQPDEEASLALQNQLDRLGALGPDPTAGFAIGRSAGESTEPPSLFENAAATKTRERRP